MKINVAVVILGLMMAACGVDAMRIIGYKIKRYRSRKYVDTYAGFGDTSDSTGAGEKWVQVATSYCWVYSLNDEGDCHVMVKISTSTSVAHWQIYGGEVVHKDRVSHSYHCAKTTWGDTTRGTKVKMIDGFGPITCGNSDGYILIYMYVEKTPDAPLLKAFSYQFFMKSNRQATRGEKFFGAANGVDASPHTIAEFKTWDDEWKYNTIVVFKYYKLATKLVRLEIHTNQKNVLSQGDATAKSRTIQNDGCGTTFQPGMTGQLKDSESITLRNSASFSETYEFGFEVSATVGGDIGAYSAELSVTSNFAFSTSSNFEEEQTSTTERVYQWPYYCLPGKLCTTDILITTEKAEIPVTFVFQRGNQEFTERNMLKVTLQTMHEKTTNHNFQRSSSCKRK